MTPCPGVEVVFEQLSTEAGRSTTRLSAAIMADQQVGIAEGRGIVGMGQNGDFQARKSGAFGPGLSVLAPPAMEFLMQFMDIVLHSTSISPYVVQQYGLWDGAILFVIIFPKPALSSPLPARGFGSCSSPGPGSDRRGRDGHRRIDGGARGGGGFRQYR